MNTTSTGMFQQKAVVSGVGRSSAAKYIWIDGRDTRNGFKVEDGAVALEGTECVELADEVI